MVWNSTSPDGTKSVKANVPKQQQNTTYIENTLGNITNNTKDHFWNIGVDEDGHHRTVQMMDYADTYIGAPSDAALATGMDGALYLKTVAGTIQGFYRNAAGIYQFIPAFLTGTAALTTAGFTNVVAVPNNTYGQIFIFRQGSNKDVSAGSFIAQGGFCNAISSATLSEVTLVPYAAVIYGFGTNVSGLNVRAKVNDGSNGTYEYRIMYWGI